MNSPFEAEDLVKRGILSSLIGFKWKPTKQQQPENSSNWSLCHSNSSQSSGCSTSRRNTLTVGPPIAVQPADSDQIPLIDDERTPFDIYREIVTEAEQIERSSTTTPMSEFTSSTPTSPTPMTSSPSLNSLAFSPPSSISRSSALSPNSLIDIPMHIQHHTQHQSMSGQRPCPFMNMNPNPMMFMPQQAFDPPPAYNQDHRVPQIPQMMPYIHPSMQQMPQILQNIPVKKEVLESTLLQTLNTQVTLEDFVKLVVSAVKEKENNSEEESPEEILRRKRQQNNEAAARYRKRQRDAKERAGGELSELLERNRDLKCTVEQMQREIELLKQTVLDRGNTASLDCSQKGSTNTQSTHIPVTDNVR